MNKCHLWGDSPLKMLRLLQVIAPIGVTTCLWSLSPSPLVGDELNWHSRGAATSVVQPAAVMSAGNVTSGQRVQTAAERMRPMQPWEMPSPPPGQLRQTVYQRATDDVQPIDPPSLEPERMPNRPAERSILQAQYEMPQGPAVPPPSMVPQAPPPSLNIPPNGPLPSVSTPVMPPSAPGAPGNSLRNTPTSPNNLAPVPAPSRSTQIMPNNQPGLQNNPSILPNNQPILPNASSPTRDLTWTDSFATIDNSPYVSAPIQYLNDPCECGQLMQASYQGPVYQGPAYQGPVTPIAATPVVTQPTIMPIPAASTPQFVPAYYDGGVGYKPLLSFGQEYSPVVLGRGIIGQPTAYVPGQSFRNFLRYLAP